MISSRLLVSSVPTESDAAERMSMRAASRELKLVLPPTSHPLFPSTSHRGPAMSTEKQGCLSANSFAPSEWIMARRKSCVNSEDTSFQAPSSRRLAPLLPDVVLAPSARAGCPPIQTPGATTRWGDSHVSQGGVSA